MVVRLHKAFTFEAAHWLPTFPEGHKCRRMHGHSFQVEVVVEGEVDPAKGYMTDYGDICAVCEPVLERLDHRLLNEVEGLENPTAENLTRWLWDRLVGDLPHLAEVVVRETCTAACHYRGQ